LSTRRWIIGSLLVLVGVPIVALLFAAVTILAFGVSIDISHWRETIAARASAGLGRPVVLDGRLELELGPGLQAALHAAGVRILNPPGFTSSELATLGEARARIDLSAALHGRLHVRNFEAADGRVRLERAADGRANWTMATSTPVGSPSQFDRASPIVAIEIERTSIRNFAFEYHDQRSGAHHFLDLDELTGIGKWSEPLKLTLRGSVAKSFPYSIAIEGGSARLLQEGRAAWPFTLDLEFLGTRLHAGGTLDIAAGAARFDFGAGTEDLRQVGRFLQTSLPSFGAAALTGTVVADASAVEVKDLHGALGASELAGRLALTLGGARRRISGELTLATLDMRPLFDAAPQRTDQPRTYNELMGQRLPVHALVPVDADLVLRVGRWLGFVVEVRDVQIALQADERGMRAPISGTIAGVPLTGRIGLETVAPIPLLALELNASNLPLQRLGELFPSPNSFEGKLGSVALKVGARGETLGALVEDLELRLVAAPGRLRYTNAARSRPVDLTLDALEVVIPRGQPLRGTARGTMLGARATLAFRAGRLPQMLREPTTPIELEVAAVGAVARIEGTLAWPGTARGSDLAFRFDARRAGDLAPWLDVAAESNLKVALRGRAQVDGGGWRLVDTTLKLGRSELTLDAHRASNGSKPILVVAARSPLIDVPELKTLRGKPADAPAPSLQAVMDMPILLRGIDLATADIGVGLTRVVLGRVELVDVGFGAQIRDGRLAPSPFAARFAGVSFEGLIGLDLRHEVPEVSLSMSTHRVDVGALLRMLGVAEDIDAHADLMQVKLDGSGSSLNELLRLSTFEARLTGGDVTVRGPANRPVAEIRLEKALVVSNPGKPVTLRLQGALSETPVEITVATGTLADFARDASRVPFSVDAKAAGARLALKGMVVLPLGHGSALTLELAGERLDSLNTLARAELPPWNLWSVEGPLNVTPTGYEVTQLAVRVGESRLYGRVQLDLTGARPRLDVHLDAPTVQLDDFPFTARAEGRQPVTPGSLRATASSAAAQTQGLLSRAFLRRLDAYLDVAVEHVQSGSDHLGGGTLRGTLVDGVLQINSAEVSVPGGSAELSMSYDSTGPEVAVTARVHVDRFDYGVLARRLRPGADLAGRFSLTLDLAGKAPTLSRIMQHANGYIDFAAWPTNLRGGVIDRWSINLFFALLPFVDPGAEAHVNCLVMRLDIRDGTMTQDALLIDTTRVRVFGAGSANFATEAISFRFLPRAKRGAVLSLQPPIDVTGTMTDFRVNVPTGLTGDMVARFFASLFVVPIQTLTQGRLPLDGADVCTDPLRQ